MKTVVTRPSAYVAQRITNMERLAPGFTEPSVDVGAAFPTERADFVDKPVLVLARDYRAFTDWCRGQQGPRGRFRYVSRGVEDLRGYHAGDVEIVELPDWRQSMPYSSAQEVERALEALAPPPLTATTAAPLQPLAGRNASGRKVPPQSPTSPSISRSTVITVERCPGSCCNGKAATKRNTVQLDHHGLFW